MEIAERIAKLRALMSVNKIDAYLITGTDPHLSEYTPNYWKTREWIFGFSGSYGKVLVTSDKVFLWTDTRYFMQALEQIKGSEIELMKERVPNAISLELWLTENLKPGNKFALDGSTISAHDAASISSVLTAKGILFDATPDLVGMIWKDRINKDIVKVYEHPLLFAGKSRIEKITAIRQKLLSMELDAIVVTMLDDLAWLFNIRSSEIEFTPLVTAFGYIDQDSIYLAIQPGKIEDSLYASLKMDGINIISYKNFQTFLLGIKNKRIHSDPIRTNFRLRDTLSQFNYLDSSTSLVSQLKAIKDTHEIENIKEAHRKDGIAMVEFLYWLTTCTADMNLTEVSVGIKLNEFRSKQPFFMGDSFYPIIGFGAHGAIVHYHSTDQTDIPIGPGNLLLIDSGGQYLDGTTDITRTICLGSATEQQKKDFTLCLKAHISLANAIFPKHTKGYSLDSIARKPLWDNELNYGHGTGHGIGYFLSVHEGPMSIRAEYNPEPIQVGHVLSNEPGIYREGEYGIRIENVILCIHHSSGVFGEFLSFETISLCPIARNMISIELLDRPEIEWINHYHEKVFNILSPCVKSPEVKEWLRIQCNSLYEK
jgi:Xaa-Pro aminopeptidase